MAKGIKTGGRDVKKGQVLNPHGRPKTTPETKAIRKMNQDVLTGLLNKYMFMTRPKLNALIKDPKTEAIDLIVISAVNMAIKKAENSSRAFLIERLCGKVKDQVEVTGITHKSIIDAIKEDS